MHARSTTITGDPHAVPATVAYIRDEALPAMTSLDGCYGLSLVADHALGRVIATSSWRDEAAMHASDVELAERRSRAGKILGGSARTEEWQVARMHRDHTAHEGCCCAITWARADDVAAVVESWPDERLPALEDLSGFCSASLLVNLAHGLACETVTFDSRAAAVEAGDRGSPAWAGEILHAGLFDLEIAHLRVPELA